MLGGNREWVDNWMEEWIGERDWEGEWMDGRIHEWGNRVSERWMNGRMRVECLDGQVDA